MSERGRSDRLDRALQSFADGLWWGMITVLVLAWWQDRKDRRRDDAIG